MEGGREGKEGIGEGGREQYDDGEKLLQVFLEVEQQSHVSVLGVCSARKGGTEEEGREVGVSEKKK